HTTSRHGPRSPPPPAPPLSQLLHRDRRPRLPTTVLYPWHHQLDEEFKKMKVEQARMLKELHDAKIQKFQRSRRGYRY
ncbi:hypothetical protein BC629DRAFT_298578, partial [Irpex lacteus]